MVRLASTAPSMSQTLPPQLDSLESDVIRLAPFAVIVCDEVGIVRFANPRAEELFGSGPNTDFSITGRELNTLSRDIDHRNTETRAIRHVLPAQGKRPSLVVRCERFEVADEQWTCFYLTEPEKRRERELVLEREANTDQLSGLSNRRAFQRMMEGHQHKALSLAFIDIDYFKSVNDIHGHVKGDDVIRHVSKILKEFFADRSIAVARMGGDEFSVLFETEGNSLVKLLDEFRIAVHKSRLEGSDEISISMSIGAVISRSNRFSSRKLLTEADRQLYQAKAAGRNCVSHAILDSFPK